MVASWKQFNADERRQRIERALNIAGVGTVLVQNYINRVVQQLSLRHLGVQSTLMTKPGQGTAAYINRRTVGTTGAEWVADTDSLTEETGSYAQASFSYATLATQIRVTRKAQARGAGYADILATELEFKNEDFDNAFETGLCTGDTGANGDADGINGLLTLIRGVSAQVVANTSATAGAALVLGMLDKTIDLVKGNAADKVIFGSLKACRILNAALQAQQQFVNMVDVPGGFRVRSYDGVIPIVPTTGIPDTLTWSGTDLTVFSGSTTSCLVVVNKRSTWIEDLTPKTVEPLARASSQYDLVDLYRDTALVYANNKAGAILGGLGNVNV